jgi:hypothetical protein
MGIRYLVVINRPAPQPYAPAEVPMPEGALAALREQLDLREIEINPGVALFAAEGAWPLRSDVTGLAIPDNGLPTLAEQLPTALATPPPVLGTLPGTSFSGEVEADHDIAQSVTADPAWRLEVDGQEATRTDLFGWSQEFRTDAGGAATLTWSTPWSMRTLQALQVVALLLLLVLAGRRRRLVTPRRARRSRSDDAVVVVGPEGLLAEATTAETAAEAAEELGGDADPEVADPEVADAVVGADDEAEVPPVERVVRRRAAAADPELDDPYDPLLADRTDDA